MPAAEDFRLAVVLPVFNTERDLPECLASISAQTHGRFVVFAVDDSSSDGSLSILEAAAKADPRFRLLKLARRSGTSAARNAALAQMEAEGGFDAVCFVDSDDRIREDCFRRCAEALSDDSVDFAVFGWRAFDRSGPERERIRWPEETRLVDREAALWHFWRPATDADGVRDATVARFIGNKCFRTSAIRGLRYDESLARAEDQRFCMDVLERVRSGAVVPEMLYEYRLRRSSLSHRDTRQLDDIRLYLNFWRELKDTASKRVLLALRIVLCHSLWINMLESVSLRRDPAESRALRALYRDVRRSGFPVLKKYRKKFFIYGLGDAFLRHYSRSRAEAHLKRLEALRLHYFD